MATVDPGLEALIRDLPKVELHVHLEGSVQPELALRLAERHGVELPGCSDGIEGVRGAFEFAGFREFIRLYVAISSCLQTVDDFTEVVDEVAGGLAEQGVRHVEMTVTPMTHVTRGVAAAVVLDGLAQGRERARDRHGVEIAWVFDIVRSFPDQAIPTVEMAIAERSRGAVALGVGGPEGERWPASPELIDAFDRARAAGLHRVPHAGEQTGAWAVREAVEKLHAERIGHGFRVLEDPKLVERLVADSIALEVCPGSNVSLGLVESLAAHPLPRLDAAEIPWSLNSDDPSLFSTSLVDEYLRCAECFDWGAEEIAAVARAAVEHSFLDARTKQSLIGEQIEVLASHVLAGE